MIKFLSTFFPSLSRLLSETTTSDHQEITDCTAFLETGDYEKAIKAGKLAIKKYPKDPKGYRCLGRVYPFVMQFDLAYENLKKAEKLTNNNGDLIDLYKEIGELLFWMSHRKDRLDDALSYFNKALALASVSNITGVQAGILHNVAKVYLYKGDIDKALLYFKMSLSLQTDEKEKVPTYENIIIAYKEKGDYQKVDEYLQKIIEIYEKYGDSHDVAKHKLDSGDIYRGIKDYENAEKYIAEGIEDAKKIGNKHLEAVGYWNLGKLYRDKGDKETARKFYTLASDFFKSIGNEGTAWFILKEMEEL
ncbi:MAG: tetratricopeptide repeat protein [Sulfurihydrogenibium sp.]|nr:tetratricopeptide repeat protein [Sulfurihydrogenibium sp.]